MDVLADRLERARARGAVFVLSTLTPPWGVEMTDATPLSVHAVLQGEVWLTPAEGEPVRLLQGDVALVHSAHAYRLADDPATACLPPAPVPNSGDGQALVQSLGGAGGREATTVLLCGAYRFEGDVCDTLLAALPPVARVHSGEGRGSAPDAVSMRAALAILADEVARDAAGQRAVLDRLLDLLLVFTLRSWFAVADDAPPWYRALDDRAVATALRLMHEDYGRRWTVEQLAAAAGLSRAGFARRFTALVASTPMGYLTEWRMTVAAELLRTSDRTVASIAREVGYDNEFAFSSAFRRVKGVPPTRFRRAA